MLDITYTSRFKRDIKKQRGNYFPDKEFIEVVNILRSRKRLPAKYKDHSLKGQYSGFRECHLLYDMLLIYCIDEKKKLITLVRVGTHQDLF